MTPNHINNLKKLNQPVIVTYRHNDDVYHCPSTTADEAYGIEWLGTDDFEVILANGVVYSSDIEDMFMQAFLDEVFENN